MAFGDIDPGKPVEEVYIGDGLYASYDGYQIKLRAPRAVMRPGQTIFEAEEVMHEVFLEYRVWVALKHFVSTLERDAAP